MTKLKIEKRFETIQTKHELFRHLESLLKDSDVRDIETINIDANNKLITAEFNFDKEE